MAKISRKKSCEILRRAIFQNPYEKAPLTESAINEIAGIDSGPATSMRRGFHRRRFLTTTSKLISLTNV